MLNPQKTILKTAIIGAGPYGLSIAAHFRRHGIPFRIFGRPMDSWLAHMPKGMMLKSDGFASDIYDPERSFTLRRFCAERGIEYSDTGIPVGLDTFAAYGLAFRERMVPELEDRLVVGLDHLPSGFRLRLEDGEKIIARRVVLAVGITHFCYVPTELSNLPSEFLSHSFHHHDLAPYKGRKVIVIGGGASALDLAGLLRDAEAEVQLVARQPSLKFHSGPAPGRRSWWKRIRHPQSGLGPGLRSRFFADAAAAFHYLPEHLRLHFVRTTLGPSGGWFIREKVMGRVPILLGHRPERAEIKNGRVHLHLRRADGTPDEVVTEHVIAATGYRVDLKRVSFLSEEIRSKIKAVNGAPVLSAAFESSVPGLYFAGVAAANSFGPVMRFAFGAGFAARTLTRALLKGLREDSISVAVASESATATDDNRAIEEEPALRS
jgi:thioredoxin reductase